jgi:hypothetical protein
LEYAATVGAAGVFGGVVSGTPPVLVPPVVVLVPPVVVLVPPVVVLVPPVVVLVPPVVVLVPPVVVLVPPVVVPDSLESLGTVSGWRAGS